MGINVKSISYCDIPQFTGCHNRIPAPLKSRILLITRNCNVLSPFMHAVCPASSSNIEIFLNGTVAPNSGSLISIGTEYIALHFHPSYISTSRPHDVAGKDDVHNVIGGMKCYNTLFSSYDMTLLSFFTVPVSYHYAC